MFFNDTATTEIYTLSLHDALPIFQRLHELILPLRRRAPVAPGTSGYVTNGAVARFTPPPAATPAPPSPTFCFTSDRKSTRLNSSHANISYAAFCLKKTKLISAKAI